MNRRALFQAPPRETMELVIPSQSLRGILQAVTEIKPIQLPVGTY